MNPLDGLPQQRRHGKGPDPGGSSHRGLDRDGVGDQKRLQPGGLDPVELGPRKDAVDGSRAVAIGTSTYWTDATRSNVARVYYNNWLLEFDDDMQCRSFTEYYMAPRKS